MAQPEICENGDVIASTRWANVSITSSEGSGRRRDFQ
jgi:hypothetical protein